MTDDVESRRRRAAFRATHRGNKEMDWLIGRFAQADSTATRQKGGTGLGLAICKRLVELMHGHIGFDDRPGGGTTFWFELPRHRA